MTYRDVAITLHILTIHHRSRLGLIYLSVDEFERALEAKTSPQFAIVSQPLFFALDNLGKITVSQVTRPIPDKPENMGSVAEFFKNYRENSKSAITITYFVLSERPSVHVSSVSLHPHIKLEDLGVNSFRLYGD